MNNYFPQPRIKSMLHVCFCDEFCVSGFFFYVIQINKDQTIYYYKQNILKVKYRQNKIIDEWSKNDDQVTSTKH